MSHPLPWPVPCSLLHVLKPKAGQQPLSLDLHWALEGPGRAFGTMVGLQPSERPPTTAVKFLGAGTAACFADLLTFPLDTAKVRLQVGALWLRVIVPNNGEAEFSTRAPALPHREP